MNEYEQTRRKNIRTLREIEGRISERIILMNHFNRDVPEGESPFDPTPEIIARNKVRKAIELAERGEYIPPELRNLYGDERQVSE